MSGPYRTPSAQPAPRSRRASWLGWLCLVPAAAVGVWQLLIPAVGTVVSSFFSTRLGRSGGGRFVGLEAYTDLRLLEPLLFSVLIGLPTFVVAGGLGVAVGTLAAQAIGPLRLAVRAVLGVFLVLYAPVGLALALRTEARGSLGALTLTLIITVALLPLTTAIAATVMLAVARPDARTGASQRVLAGAVAVGIGLITALALSIQAYDLPIVVTGGGPARSTETPGTLIYRLGFQLLNLGEASAVSAVLLVLLAVLGLLVTGAVVALPVRVDLVPESAGTGAGRRSATLLGVGALVTLGVTALIFFVLARDWVLGLASFDPQGLSLAEAVRGVLNTWLPPAVTVVVQVLVGGLAAFGIGVLRPLGRWSEWLMIAFAPGLFIGLTPLVFNKFTGLISAGGLNDAALVPPMLLSVPIVVVLTFVFAGLRRAWPTGPGPRAPILLAGAASVVFVGTISYVVLAQSILWNLVVANDPDRLSGPALLLRLAQSPLAAGSDLPQQLATPVPVLLVLGVLAALAIVGLDRLVIRVGPPNAIADTHRSR